MQNSNPMGNPNMPPGGYAPPNQGQLHQQQPGVGYYGQPALNQQPQMTMQGQQMMMSGGSAGIPMNYQGGVPQMMQQTSVPPNPTPSMMQQAMFGAQGALSSVSRPFPGPGTTAPTGYTNSSSSISMPIGGVSTQAPQSYATQPTQQQGAQQQLPPQPGTGYAGQQSQQHTAVTAQQSYAFSHGASAAPGFVPSSNISAPTHGVDANVQQATTSQPRPTKSEAKRPLNPPPYSPQILEHLDKFSVGTLTVIGRELVSELTTRTHSLCVSLKAVSERKPPTAGDPEQLLEYCQMLMDKLVEIRMKIVNLNNDLKMLDWMANVMDPSLLKKVDKMTSSVRERE